MGAGVGVGRGGGDASVFQPHTAETCGRAGGPSAHRGAERSGVAEAADAGRCAAHGRTERETKSGGAEDDGSAATARLGGGQSSWGCRCAAGSPTREESTWCWWEKNK